MVTAGSSHSIMPVKTFQETLQYIVSLNHGIEWIPESWTNAPLHKVGLLCQLQLSPCVFMA